MTRKSLIIGSFIITLMGIAIIAFFLSINIKNSSPTNQNLIKIPLPEDSNFWVFQDEINAGLMELHPSFQLWPDAQTISELDNHPVEWLSSLSLDTPQDLLWISVENPSLEKQKFILKIFYNFEETSFLVMGNESYSTEFQFSIEGPYELRIPFKLDKDLEANETLNNLAVGVFLEPDAHVSTDSDGNIFEDTMRGDIDFNEMVKARELAFSSGWVRHFEISYGGSDALDLNKDNITYALQTSEFDFVSFGINQLVYPNQDPFYFSGILQGRAGEYLELVFYANQSATLHDGLLGKTLELNFDEYLLMVMLDWNQIEISGNSYLLIDNGSDNQLDKTSYGSFFIEMPDEPGFYEFVAILVTDPTELTFSSEVIRFTIEVI